MHVWEMGVSQQIFDDIKTIPFESVRFSKFIGHRAL